VSKQKTMHQNEYLPLIP